jgi:hypothetical protein
VVVRVNGKERTADARSTAADHDAESMELSLDLRGDPRLLAGQENSVEVFAYNAEGYLRSRGAKRVFSLPAQELAVVPKMWAIVVGVSDYRGNTLDLAYAARDAIAFARSLRVAGSRLFGDGNTHVSMLSTATTDPADWPTRANLKAAIERVAQRASANDVVVLYLAGHGVTYGGQDGDFYFLTSDAHTGDLTDPGLRSTTALSSNELTELVNRVPALKQVMVFDTCAAGRFIEKLTERRSVSSTQIRSLDRLKDRTGMYVLAGCAADRVSYEASRYGQGLLTYSLLLGIRGAALREQQFVDVSTLFNFATDKVPELAEDVGGIQRPLMAVPRSGASFDIGRILPEDRVEIPIQSVRPVLVRCSFQDERRFRDHLGLSSTINDLLRDESARGREAVLLFVDADRFPDAYELVGRYRVQGASVSVHALLLQGDEVVADFQVIGSAEQVRGIAERLVAETRANVAATP